MARPPTADPRRGGRSGGLACATPRLLNRRPQPLTKTKKVQIVQEPWSIGADERRYAETMYPMIQNGMRTGLYIPNRAGFLCSRRYCGYWRQCEREYGGVVKE